MKFFKADTERWEVREVDGEPWPGKDSEGDTCFDNTHFLDMAKALEKLEREASAWVQLAGRNVADQRNKTKEAEFEAATAAAVFGEVKRAVRDFQNTTINGERSESAA